MNFDYTKRLDALAKRRSDPDFVKKAFTDDSLQKSLLESYQQLEESETVRYIVGSMSPVSTTYTKNSFREAERVQNQLQKLSDLGFRFEFKYQGSVTNGTHIKTHSDLDILTLHLGFTTLEHPLKPSSPYKGNPEQDLLDLRNSSYNILSKAFPGANLDATGAKSFSIQGGSLRRKFDIVPANWYNTVLYDRTNDPCYRGIQVLDCKKMERILNTPFYHNKLLNDKDAFCSGYYKGSIRLLKTIKADSKDTENVYGDIQLSSYDIAAILYHMEAKYYRVDNRPLLLTKNILDYLVGLYRNDSYRSSLQVPDESRYIFGEGRSNSEGLETLIDQVQRLYDDLMTDLKSTGDSIYKSIIA